MVAGGKRMVRDFGKVMYMLLSLKWITSKDLHTAQGTLFKVMWQPGWGGGFGGEWIHMCVWLSPFAVHLKLPEHH